jgi:hypothetical protein
MRGSRSRLRRLVATVSVPALLIAPLSASGAPPAHHSPWLAAVPFTNRVVSSPTSGGGFPDSSGVPVPGTCVAGPYDSNHYESWLAVKPGTETIVGVSKYFFDRFSTFHNFHVGALTIDGATATNRIVQGYDCVTTGTQAMPPTWTNVTDPNVAFDTKGRAYQTLTPFNAYWTSLNPGGAVDVSYSDDMGAHWIKGNRGEDLEKPSNSSSFSRKLDDKQFIAVNQIPGSPNQDHVYAAWTMYKGTASEVRIAVSGDRGETFSAPVRITAPGSVGSKNSFVYPAVDAAGDVYASFVSLPNNKPATIHVTRSVDDGRTWSEFTPVATVDYLPTCCLPGTSFLAGLIGSFAASPTYPGHLYVVWESWDGAQADVMLSQSTDGGRSWSLPSIVNDNVDAAGIPTHQFQPTIAVGAGGAVAVGFFDQRGVCPNDASVLAADIGKTASCIDTSIQALHDGGLRATPVGANVRASSFSWDPRNPAQKRGGLNQLACAGFDDTCPYWFIGDYIGLAISGKNVYALVPSTHYPSSVAADGGGPIYYSQQVLSTISRAAMGL